MNRPNNRTGMTLVEVLIAVVLVSLAATLVYNGGFSSYRTMMRSRERLEAQGIAFDKLWVLFNMPLSNLRDITNPEVGSEPTPEGCAFSTNGLIEFSVIPETDEPVAQIDYWEIIVQVWAPSNSALFSVMNEDGTVRAVWPEPLARYSVLRYPGER